MRDDARHRQNLAYCADQVKGNAEDLYLSALFAPQQEREKLICLYAFLCEINRIPESVSEPALGAIRQQWWREALDEAFSSGKVRAHPVVEVLQEVLSKEVMPSLKADLLGIIDAIEPLLEEQHSSTTTPLEEILQGTFGQTTAIATAIVLKKPLSPEDHANCKTWGMLWALSRALVFSNPEKNNIAGLSKDTLFSELSLKYEITRTYLKKLESTSSPALAYGRFIPIYLGQSQNQKKHIAPSLKLRKQVLLIWAVLTGKI